MPVSFNYLFNSMKLIKIVKSPTAVESFGINVFTSCESALSAPIGVTSATLTIPSLVLPRQDDIGAVSRSYGSSSNRGAIATQLHMHLEEEKTVPQLDNQEDSDNLDLFENGILPEIMNQIGIILEDATAPDFVSEDEDISFTTARLLPKELQQPALSCFEGEDFAVDQDDNPLGNASMSDLSRQFLGEEGIRESIQEARSSLAEAIQSLYSTPNREFESSFRSSNNFISYCFSEWDPIRPDDSFLNTSMTTPNLAELLENISLPPLSPINCSTQKIESHDHSPNASQDFGNTNQQSLNEKNNHEDLGVRVSAITRGPLSEPLQNNTYFLKIIIN